jgi:2-oxo-4-hydroxy-4-carboxy-5-ureidoimidazoline decarboxylase
MVEPHVYLNQLDSKGAAAALRRACGAERWVTQMNALCPFPSTRALLDSAERVWRRLERADYLEAFAHHPQIGEDLEALRSRFRGPLDAAAREQAGVANASEHVLVALRDGNRAYRERFGYIFIVCATGKTADEMLELLGSRLGADPGAELVTAAEEQAKITRLRLLDLGR